MKKFLSVLLVLLVVGCRQKQKSDGTYTFHIVNNTNKPDTLYLYPHDTVIIPPSDSMKYKLYADSLRCHCYGDDEHLFDSAWKYYQLFKSAK